MTDEQIRNWASKAYKDINNRGDSKFPSQAEAIYAAQIADMQMGQMLMMAEIAAQLAEANRLTRFELGLDDSEEKVDAAMEANRD